MATHRSVIAGLHGEERTKSITDELNRRFLRSSGATPADVFKKRCMLGAPFSSLRVLLEQWVKDNLLDLARSIGLKGYSKLNKHDLIEAIDNAMAERELLEGAISLLAPKQLADIQRVFDAGGRIDVAEDDVRDLRLLPEPAGVYLMAFYENGMFSFVIPDKFMATMQGLDWDKVHRENEKHNLAARYVSMSTQLRGIVGQLELINAYERDVAQEHRLSRDDFMTEMYALSDNASDDAVCMEATLDGKIYLLDFDLADEMLPWLGVSGYDLDSHHGRIEAPLDGFAKQILRARLGKPIRPVSDDMLAEADLSDWLMKQPCAIALRDFLDENVPDDGDDYFFADNTVFELAHMVLEDYMPGQLLEYINQVGLEPEASLLPKLLDLITKFVNGLPHWLNSGWSPVELREAHPELYANPFSLQDETPIWYDPDDKIIPFVPAKTPGRNDPCPCGSGKKYKKCCGKNK